MRLLFLTDRLNERGGALHHLLDVIRAAPRAHTVAVASGEGRPEALGSAWPAGVVHTRIRALAAAEAEESGLDALDALLAKADVVHAQNLMNPAALRRAIATGRAVVTVQDHRVFCPGPGKTLPDGRACDRAFALDPCATCLPDPAYLQRMVGLTAARRDALRGARLVVLSTYMAEALAEAGLPGAAVIPPWVSVGPPREEPGSGFGLGGRLVAHKGVDLGWSAWRESKVDAPLLLAGAGRLAPLLVGATPLGWLEPTELSARLRQVRALLFPARWQEPFGLLGLEALAQGVPVVALDRGGIRDWAQAGVLRVPDTAAMAEAIRALHADPSAALALGEQGRQAVAARFSEAALLPKLESIYAETAGG